MDNNIAKENIPLYFQSTVALIAENDDVDDDSALISVDNDSSHHKIIDNLVQGTDPVPTQTNIEQKKSKEKPKNTNIIESANSLVSICISADICFLHHFAMNLEFQGNIDEKFSVDGKYLFICIYFTYTNATTSIL